MLENHFLGPLLAHPALAEHSLWQEDNAPAHRSREAMAWKEANWMKELKPQWPANSPDLSPLDYGIWTLENKVYPTKQALKVAITKAVNELNSDEHWPTGLEDTSRAEEGREDRRETEEEQSARHKETAKGETQEQQRA
eukprot:2134956-Amphidinium_carterae.1